MPNLAQNFLSDLSSKENKKSEALAQTHTKSKMTAE
jgi:hypothetical protein